MHDRIILQLINVGTHDDILFAIERTHRIPKENTGKKRKNNGKRN